MKRSAGILPYKIKDNKIKVFLEHPGGPFWKGVDKWSICKGEYTTENALDAAIREFYEESGHKIDPNKLEYLGGKKQSNKKLVNIFIVQTDLDPENIKSNTFKKEWPPGSGVIEEFPEMDEAKWFNINEAYEKIFPGQKYFLDKLKEKINN